MKNCLQHNLKSWAYNTGLRGIGNGGSLLCAGEWATRIESIWLALFSSGTHLQSKLRQGKYYENMHGLLLSEEV
jgi:hypothetical protein